MNSIEWMKVADENLLALHQIFSRSARHRGVLPFEVFELCRYGETDMRDRLFAMHYHEPSKWERWALVRSPQRDIVEPWSRIVELLRPLIGDRAALEIYPRDCDTLNSAPMRWFWLFPSGQLPFELDLRSREERGE